MKKIFFPILIILITLAGHAQLDRSIRPKPGPAPKIQLGEYELFTLDNGLKVIVVENNKIPKVTYQVTLDTDPVIEGESAGFVSLTGNLLRAGTTTKTKAEIDEAIDFIGASLGTYSTGVSGSVLKKFSNEFLELMSDVLLNPVFPEEELEKLKKQNISGIQTAKNNASSIAQNINTTVAYGNNHPYGEIVTEKSLEEITLDKCKAYYSTYFRPNKAYLIIVGDITLAEAKTQAQKYFGSWKAGDVPENKYTFPEVNSKPEVYIGNRDGAVQSVIMVSIPLQYTPGNPDVIKAGVMNEILGGGSLSSRINANLREDKAYTYGAYSSLRSDKLVGMFTASGEVKGTATDSAMVELLKEIGRMSSEPVDSKVLESVKNKMNGSFARSLESPQTIAGFALNIERYNLPKDYYATYLEKLSKVSVDDVQAMAKKYLDVQKANIIAVGNAAELKKTMARFAPDGKVTQLDFYGKPVTEMDIPAGISGNDVIAKYVEAIGGKARLAAVKDIVTKSSMMMQGMTIDINVSQKAPNKILVETGMGGNVMSKQICDGEKAKITSPMGEQVLEGADLEDMKIQATLNNELYYDKLGVKVELTGQENVDGKKAWKVQVVKPSGKSTVEYYDQESGLKLKSVAQQGQMSVTTVYKDYREVDGILIPFKITQSMGPQNFDVETKEVLINKGIEDSVFAL